MKSSFLRHVLVSVVTLMTSTAMFAGDWPAVTLPTITSTQTFDIISYGASTTANDNTTAIQVALNACHTAGGGKVIIPAGTFLCGPITMYSSTNLYLSAGATLQILPYGTGNGTGSDGTQVYYPNNGTTNQYNNFISCASGATNLIISGEGTIYGNGSAWWTAYDSNSKIKRGGLIRFNKAKYIEITGITLKDAPGSHITVGTHGNTSHVTIHDITINTNADSPNTDGIDVWAPYVNIYNCNISDGDDNVAIDDGSQYVSIKNCTFGYGHGTSVGSYTTGIKHVLVDHCTFTNTDNGFRLKSDVDRGGGEADFTMSNCTMDYVSNPVIIYSYYTSGYPASPWAAKGSAVAMTSTTPTFRDILLQNITATNVPNNNKSNAYKNQPILIYGRPESHIKNVVFDNVNIQSHKGMVINFADSVKFINGCVIPNLTTGGLTMNESYDATFVDSLAGFTMPVSTANVSASGKDADTQYEWVYTNMKYDSSASTKTSKTYYEFNSSASVVLTAPSGLYFHTGDMIVADAYTSKSGKFLTAYTSSDMSTCIGTTALSQDSTKNYYMFLTNVPDNQSTVYMGGSSTINAYVYINGISVYGNKTTVTGIENVTASDDSSKTVKDIRYYDISGRQLSSAVGGQVVICRKTYTDGSSNSTKLYLK